MNRSKYRNVRTEVDGIKFASRAEAKRYQELKILERAGEITRLDLQPRFDCWVNGNKVCTYVSDFRYFTDAGQIIEDVKGMKTPVYKLKKKLVEACYPGVKIIEIK
jgi:hypothetical protein